MAIEKITDLYPKDNKDVVLRPNVKSENIIDKDTSVLTKGHVPDSNLVQMQLSSLKEYLTENYISKSQSGTYSKEITFSEGVKTDIIHNSANNAMLRYKSDNSAIIAGSSEKAIVLMGSGDRPKYSKSGTDFVGNDLALYSDIPSTAKNLYQHIITMEIKLTSDSSVKFSGVFSLINSSSSAIESLKAVDTGYFVVQASGTFQHYTDNYRPCISIIFHGNDSYVTFAFAFLSNISSLIQNVLYSSFETTVFSDNVNLIS